ncbi:MAG: hypothetical protein ACYS3S_15500 [Planctomycetota bacterium]|jgi:hypothetical protein
MLFAAHSQIPFIRSPQQRLGATEIRRSHMRQACEAADADWPMPESIETTYEQFKKVALKNNVTRLNEWQDGFGNLDKALENFKK